jgi:hypothetical protein
VIAAITLPSALAAREATSTIPIVFIAAVILSSWASRPASAVLGACNGYRPTGRRGRAKTFGAASRIGADCQDNRLPREPSRTEREEADPGARALPFFCRYEFKRRAYSTIAGAAAVPSTTAAGRSAAACQVRRRAPRSRCSANSRTQARNSSLSIFGSSMRSRSTAISERYASLLSRGTQNDLAAASSLTANASTAEGGPVDWRKEFLYWESVGVTHVAVNNTYARGPHRRIAGRTMSDHLQSIKHYYEAVADLL